MAESFAVVKTEKNLHVLQKDIRSRTLECFVPRCWLLEEGDNGQIYLTKKMNDGDGGRWVQIRRYLFWVAYDYVPERRKLNALCGQPRCVNPAHMNFKKQEMKPQKIAEFVDKRWLSVKDAKKWYNYRLGDENE